MQQSCRGLTLLELLVVLLVLIGVAGIVTLNFTDRVTVRGADGESREVGEVITLRTMQTVREALIGNSVSDPGYRGHVGGLPSTIGGLIENVDTEPLFSPANARGWNGPYIVYEGATYGDYIETGDNFENTPASILDEPAILDGWGKPLLLQQPDTINARLVSAGANRILETDDSNAVDSDRGDDIVLFLLTVDPN
ncbi:MAG: hypothetical protein AAGH72_13130 [Verrucomicrobiota bacterium]